MCVYVYIPYIQISRATLQSLWTYIRLNCKVPAVVELKLYQAPLGEERSESHSGCLGKSMTSAKQKYLYGTFICTVSPNCQREKQTEGKKKVPSLELLTVQLNIRKDKIKCLHKHSQNNPSTNEHHIVQLFSFFSISLGPHQNSPEKSTFPWHVRSSRTRDPTCIGRRSLNHWTAREAHQPIHLSV